MWGCVLVMNWCEVELSNTDKERNLMKKYVLDGIMVLVVISALEDL